MSITDALSTIQSGKGSVFTVGCFVCYVNHSIPLSLQWSQQVNFLVCCESSQMSARVYIMLLKCSKRGHHSFYLLAHYAQIYNIQFAFPMLFSITLQFLISGSLIIKTSDHHSPLTSIPLQNGVLVPTIPLSG